MVCRFASTVILYHRVTEDWRGAVEYLIANAGPADHVLYYQPVGEFAGENYRDWLPEDRDLVRCPLRSMPTVIGNES